MATVEQFTSYTHADLGLRPVGSVDYVTLRLATITVRRIDGTWKGDGELMVSRAHGDSLLATGPARFTSI